MRYLFVVLLLTTLSCTKQLSQIEKLNDIAEEYVKLVLRVGLYDSDYVDSYFGPEEWKPEEMDVDSSAEFPFEILHSRVDTLISQLKNLDADNLRGLTKQRYYNLSRLLNSVSAKIDLLNGKIMTFDEECEALFGFVEPVNGDDYYFKVLTELDSLIPGEGEISQRFREYKSQFLVPAETIDTLFETTLKIARDETKQYMSLPADEDFTVEYVTAQSWGGFCVYLGNNKSHIQINTDKYYINWTVGLACHEGYPGHHVRGLLMDNYLVKENGWIELLVYPLYSPLSVIDEGCANYAVDLLFPLEERIEFEKNTLFPLAGLDPSEAERYYTIMNRIRQLDRSFNETARLYLDGKINRDSALVRLEILSLSTRPEQNLQFIEMARSYCITYTIGEEIVREYIGEDSLNIDACWEKFIQLQMNPTLVLTSQNR